MPNIKRRTILAAIYCSVFLLVEIFYHHIDKYLTGVPFILLTLLLPITLIIIFVNEIKEIGQIIENRRNLNLKICLPTIIYSLTLLYLFLSPYRLDSENLESKVELRACYEGTQNQAYILFRKDKTFELHWTGVFGYNEWTTGKWNRDGDTLLLKYDKGKVQQLGEIVLIKNDYLNPIRQSVDTTKFPRPMFYIGFCRGEN